MLRTYRNRSNERAALSVLSSGPTAFTNTKEASAAAQMVPTPTLAFGIKNTGTIAYAGSIVAPPTYPNPLGTSSAIAGGEAAARGDRASSASGDTEAEFGDRPESAPTTEAGIKTIEAGEIDQPSTGQTDGSQIRLSIDSLPHLELVEAFPVTVTQLSDKLFTATVEPLRLSGTSSNLSEALVMVKEEISTLFDRLSRTTHLHDDEKADLEYLQSHILTDINLPASRADHKRGY